MWRTSVTELLLPALALLPSCPESQLPPLPLTLIKAQVLLLPPCIVPGCAECFPRQKQSPWNSTHQSMARGQP